MKTWKIEDKEWLAARKAAWKALKPKIDSINNLCKEERKAIKIYYLTGENDPNWPIETMTPGLLLELWLHPDHSEERWNDLLSKYSYRKWSDARNAIVDANRGIEYYCPNGESFFDGLEEQLCHYFHFDRLQRKDWPNYTDDEYLHLARDRLLLAQTFSSYLLTPNPHPYDITPLQVRVWRDAMCLAYDPNLPIFQKIPAIKRVVQGVEKVLSDPSGYPERTVQMAKELEEVFNDPELPLSAKKDIANIRTGKFQRKKPCRKPLP